MSQLLLETSFNLLKEDSGLILLDDSLHPYLTRYGGLYVGSVATQTQSITIDGPNSTLVVGLQAYDPTTAANTIISSIKFNGVSLTQLQAALYSAGVSQFANSSYYMFAITGLSPQTANLVTTWIGTCSSPQVAWAVFANSAPAIDNSAISTNLAATVFTGSVNTKANNCLVWSFIDFNNNNNGAASGADQLQTYVSGGYDVGSASKTPQTPPGSVTHTYSNSTPDDYIMAVVSIAPILPVGKDISNLNNSFGMNMAQAINRAGTY
jgi:hypothetical protein